MFDDPRRELQRLEKELLAEEEDAWLDEQLQEAHALLGDAPEPEVPRRSAMPVRNFANGYGRDVPVFEEEEEEYDVPQPRERGLGALVLLAALETLGILSIIAYWMIMIL